MAKEIETMLIEYEQKRRDEEAKAEIKKRELYTKIPRLQEIEDELNKLSILKTKNILTSGLQNVENDRLETQIL